MDAGRVSKSVTSKSYRAAMIYSLFATCRYHNINPYDWLKDVLERMHLYTTTNMAELLPQNWKKSEA